MKVFKNSYGFLKNIGKRQKTISLIFNRLDGKKSGYVSYGDWLSWVHFTLVSRIK